MRCGERIKKPPENRRQFWYNGGQPDKEKDSVGTGVRFVGWVGLEAGIFDSPPF